MILIIDYKLQETTNGAEIINNVKIIIYVFEFKLLSIATKKFLV